MAHAQTHPPPRTGSPVDVHEVTPALFPWFVDARNAVSAFAHALFGAVAAAAYVSLRKPRAARAEPAA